jgi:DNA replication and repair protein RecF
VYLRRLSLTNFRCYRQLDVTLPAAAVVIAGGNAAGKSSLLEAIFVLATTRSPHTVADRQVISWAARDEVMPYSRVWGEVERCSGAETIEVLNVRESVEGREERHVKRARINNLSRRAFEVIGHLNVVLFTPRDLQIVDGTPSDRRRFLDVLLCQIDPAYCRSLSLYNRILSQRNHLLRRLRDRGGDRGELRFWDERLVQEAAGLLARRLGAVSALNEMAMGLHAELVPGSAPLVVTYRGSHALDVAAQRQVAVPGQVAPDLDALPLPDRRTLADLLGRLLAARRDEELARGMTLIGLHRDDLEFRIDGVDMRTYGSRGQQRTVTLALKLAEARLMWLETGERPVLLLDDVLSELDADRRQHLLTHLDLHQQTLITTTDLTVLPVEFVQAALVLHLQGGIVVSAARDGHAVPPPVGPTPAPDA